MTMRRMTDEERKMMVTHYVETIKRAVIELADIGCVDELWDLQLYIADRTPVSAKPRVSTYVN